ncbi:Spherulation-specific family 4-domain-containing protein [Aspergillus karnatakaensis]|uniref:Spherulation-specific family 4-domain-containing protein n=1 Tax=Aspergillus karnatakaensis TaxID=1810916 RepID=UPI003CCD65F4
MRLRSYLQLCGALALWCRGVLAQAIDYEAAAQSISAVMADPTFVPYSKPTQRVSEFIAVGDSYTAGTGCNGMDEILGGNALRGQRSYPMHMSQDTLNWGFVNGDQTLPRFSFHAYTGDQTPQLINEQLKPGAYEANNMKPRNQPFGAPQVAVMTIGGNDAMLSKILMDCIYRAWRPGNCEDTLNDLQEELDSGRFRLKVNTALYNVARAGRQAGGATPIESFQVFILEYITFFDDAMSPECDKYSWAFWWWQSNPKLTRALREQLNDKVRQVNAAIKAAAEELAPMGVFFVEGLQDQYNGHRYCEPGADEQMMAASVWFWTADSKVQTPSEGPGDPTGADASDDDVDIAQGLLDFIFPGEGYVVPTAESTDLSPPWEWEGAEKYPTQESLLDALQAAAANGDGDANTQATPLRYMRSFHPKGSAYSYHANALFAAIEANREVVGAGGGGGEGQQIAIASYINPLGDPASWDRLLAYDTEKVSVLVANVLNGPDYVVDADWQSVIEKAAGQGKKILGYVRTGYLGVSQQQFTTRLGSLNLADWASQIEQDIDKWYELYGSSLGGIFFDEGWPECGPDNIYADLYAHINDYTKRKHPGAYTVLNPGSPIAQCYEDTMDTLLTFENSYEAYQNSFVSNDWTPKDPRKIWHIIYKVSQDQIADVAALASSRNVGLIEITDDDQPNPYDNLPSEAYMQAVIGAVSGGTPPINDPSELGGSYVAGLPADVAVSASDYSSVTLTWSSVANALGYAVYKNGEQILELPASLTRATIGMIDPGTSGLSFEVRTALASGSGGSSRTVSASTKSLPADGAIANVDFTQSGDTVIYTADVLVPYAFVRLFIGTNQPDPGIGRGWPIQAPSTENGVAQHQIVNYLVEGNDFYSGLYEYAGSWYETTTANADWTWLSIGEAKQTQDGYTYTWSVPLGGTDAVAKEYVVQGQGYAPIKNVFMGTLRQYGTV